MRVRATFITSLVLSFVVVAASAAMVRAVGECQELIFGLQGTTQSVVILGKKAEGDRANLQGKLNEALVKLNEEKPCDAVAKLNDFIAKVQQLAGAGRISADDAALLTGDANAAIACILSDGTVCGL